MTTPASDCGVTAGCGACPLGRAGVCGDPGTERDAPTVTINDGGYLRRVAVPAPGASYFRMFDAPAHDPDPEPTDLDPAEPRPADAGCCGGGCGG